MKRIYNRGSTFQLMELGLNEAIIKRESMLGLSQMSGCHQNGVKLGSAG